MLADRPHEVLLHVRVIEQPEFLQSQGHRLARTFRHGIAMTVVIVQAARNDGLRHGLATGTAHLAPMTIDLDRKVGAAWNGQTAVIAGFAQEYRLRWVTWAACGWRRPGG